MSDGSQWVNNDRTRDVADAFNDGLSRLRDSQDEKPDLQMAQDSQSAVLNELGTFYDSSSKQSDSVPEVKPVLPEVVVDSLVRVGEVSAKNEVISTVDQLTGLLNLRGYDRQLNEKIAKQRRDNFQLTDNTGGLGFFFFDGIGFKGLNDMLGHPSGNKALQVIAGQLKKHTRRGEDILARPAGDEFIVVESLPSALDLQQMLNSDSKKSILAGINPGIVENLRSVLGAEYIEKCDGAGTLRVDGFYLSVADLEKPSEELSELIVRKMTDVSIKMEKSKRKSQLSSDLG